MNGVKFLIVVVAASLAAFVGATGAIFYLDAKKEQEKIAASEQEKLEQAQQERLRPVSPKEAFISQCTYDNSTFEGRIPEVLCELTWGNIVATPMDARNITRDTVHVGSRYIECINKWSESTREECLKAAGDPNRPWTDDYEEKMTEGCLRAIAYYEEGRIKRTFSPVLLDREYYEYFYSIYSDEELAAQQDMLVEWRRGQEEDRCSSKKNMEEYLDIVARIDIVEKETKKRRKGGGRN